MRGVAELQIQSKGMICKACQKEKPETDFPVNRSMKSGRENKCKDCKREYRPIRVRPWRARTKTIGLRAAER